MVQPRKEQVKNPKTRHASFDFEPNAGDAYTDISAATLHSYVISDVSGGAEHDTKGSIKSSTQEPYAPFALDEFSVDVGTGATSVVLDVIDTTASRIADKINTALGLTVAFNDEGYLEIVSDGVGSDKAVILVDTVLGTLARIGLTAGTYSGKDAPTRGVITVARKSGYSPNVGGFIPLRTKDGKDIVTDSNYITRVAESGSFVYHKVDTPGGMPVHARLTYDPGSSNYRLSYYAQMPLEPEIITFNSRFDLLDGTDAVDLTFRIPYKDNGTVLTQAVAVILPAGTFTGAVTRDQVVDLLNAQYGVQINTTTSDGRAFVVGTISQPYTFVNEGITIAVDGGVPAFVNLSSTNPMTAQDIANEINASVVGLTATALAYVGDNIIVKIASDNTDGLTSSIEIRSINPGSLEKLGITPGVYRGSFIAEPYGAEEIRIHGPARGRIAELTVSGLGPATADRLGISGGTIYGGDSGEQKVDLPHLDIDASNNPSVLTLIPEVIEYGEVNLAVESIVEEFNAKALANHGGRSADITRDYNSVKYARTALTRGIEDAGKPVYVNMYGQIDKNLLRSATEDLWGVIKKFARGWFQYGWSDVYALSANIIETTGTGGNPKSQSASMEFQVDPGDSFALGSREFQFGIARDGVAKTPWLFTENTTVTAWNQEFQIVGNTGIRSINTALEVADPNTEASGIATGGSRQVNFSSSTARYTRRMEVESSGDTTPQSLLDKINAAWTVTVGDGVNSFGDFNGSNAIQQAIAYFTANVGGVVPLRIQCKSGSFDINTANGAIIPYANIISSCDTIIEGLKKGSTTIRLTDATGPAIDVQQYARLTLINVTISSITGVDALISLANNSQFQAIDTEFLLTSITSTNHSGYTCDRCSFTVGNSPSITIIAGSVSSPPPLGPYIFRDCTFSGANDNPILLIKADNASAPRTKITQIAFYRCYVDLGSTTATGFNNLTGNCGVIDLDPNGSSWYRNSPNEGIQINEVLWKDCNVTADGVGGDSSILMHCIPVTNGTTLIASLTEQYMQLNRATIDGGRWVCDSGNDSNFTPFALVATAVEIKNVVLGWENLASTGSSPTNYGQATDDLGYWTNSVFASNPPSSDQWGAFAIMAQNILLDDITFHNLTQLSSSGDLFLRYTELFAKDIFMTNYLSGGSGTTPRQRIRLRAFYPTDLYGRGTISNLSIGTIDSVLSVAASGTDWATDAIIYYEPNTYMFTFDNCRIGPWWIDPAPGALTAADGISVPYTTSGAYYTNSPVNTSNLKIMGCTILECYNGISIFSSNFNQQNQSIVIDSNQIIQNGNAGIIIDTNNLSGSTGFFGNTVISNNQISGNTGYGIFLRAINWNLCSFVASSNAVSNNAASANDYQIVVDVVPNINFIDERPQGTIIGNDCSWSGNSGGILINHSDSAIRTAIASGTNAIYGGVYPAPLIRGIHTGYDSTTNDNYQFDNLGSSINMALNNAYLASGAVP